MPSNPRNPAPSRHAVLSRVTPLGTDLLFYVLKDGRLPDYKEPEYGTAWYTDEYPNHVLVHVAPADEQGWYRWYYAADRANQDQYNFEVGSFDLGGITMDAVFRTYINPRTDVVLSTPAIGSTLVSREPTTLWAAIGSEGDWLLADTETKRDVEVELASRYVVERHTYVARIHALGRKYDSKLKGTFHTTRLLYYRGETVSGSLIEDLFLNPSAGYWGMPRVGFFREGEQVNQDWFVVYERETIGLDGSTGGDLSRVGISRDKSADSDSIDMRISSVGPTAGVSSTAEGTLIAIRAEEQEDGTWVNSLSYVNPVVGVQGTTRQGAASGINVRTESVATGSSSPGSSDVSFSQDVAQRGIDGTPLQYKVVAETVQAAVGPVQRSKDASVQGVTETVTQFQDTASEPVPSAGMTGFSAQVSARSAATGAPLQYESRSSTLAVSAGVIDTDVTFRPGYTLQRDTTVTTVPLGESASDGDYNLRVAAKDVLGTAVAWQEQTLRSTATPRVAGQEIDQRPMVTLTTTERYSTSPTVGGPSGSSSIDYVDKSLVVYKVRETQATGKSRVIGVNKDARVGYRLDSTESYSLTNSLATNVGSVDIAFDDGATTVYKLSEIRAVADPVSYVSGKEERPMVALTTTTNIDTSPELTGTNGQTNVAFTDGNLTIYKKDEVTAVGKERTIGVTKDQRVGYRLETTESYSLSNAITTNIGGADIAYDDGTTTVFKKQEVRAVPLSVSYVSEKEERPMVTITTGTRFNTSPTVTTTSGQASVAFTDGAVTIYKVDEPTAVGKSRVIGVTKDARVGYTLATTESYSPDNNISTGVGGVDIAYDDGSVVVFKKQEVRAQASPVSFVSGKNKDMLTTTTVTTKYGTSPEGSGDLFGSDAVFTDGSTTIYKIDETVVAGNTPLVFPTLVRSSVPSVLRGIYIQTVNAKRGGTKYCVWTDIEAGYDGDFAGRVTMWFTKTPPSEGSFVPILFRPASISFDGVYVNFQIPATIHGTVTFQEIVGTNDPNYELATVSATFNATEPAEIPSGYVPYSRKVELYKDGFLVTDTEIKYKG